MVQRTISPTQTLASVLDAVTTSDDTIIVESGGAPKAAVISFERYQKLRDVERKERLAGARAEWQRLAEDIGDRNSDLTQEQIDELADRFADEFVDELVREGKIRFEGNDEA